MLIKMDGVKLPKLKTKPTTEKSQPAARKPRVAADDSLSVAAKMKSLFANTPWRLITTEQQLVDYLERNKEIGFDTETTGVDVFKSELCGISFGTATDCVYIPLTHKVGQNYTGDITKLETLLKQHKIYGFNLKFDLKAVKKHANITLQGAWCGYLAARLMNSLEPSNELKALYIKYIDPNAEFYSFRELFKRPFNAYDPAVVGAYAAVDAMKHYVLGKYQEQKIDKQARQLLLELELPLTHILVDIELRGVQLDLEWCQKLIAELEKDLEDAKTAIAKDYEGLNPGSPKQVAEWLYDKLKLPQIQGRGTGEGILKLMDHPLPKKILEYRKAQKLLSTYARKMPEDADDGVVHCTFNQYGADTGRFSSSGPNLQNIPRDNRFRRMFRARDGHTLVSCDYSQQEVYILAALANDQLMKDAFAKGYDFYGYMASIVFNEPYEDCQKHKRRADLRDAMKAIVLSLNYDKGIRSLSKDIGKSIEETRAIYDKFFESCPKVKDFRNEKLAFAKKHGYVETVLGRRRYFSALHRTENFECDNEEVLAVLNTLQNEWTIKKLIADARKEGIMIQDLRAQRVIETRQVVNSIIQGSAADMTKLAMLAASRNERLKQLGCQILLQVHDEIIAEFPDETAKEGGDLLAKIMTEVGTELIGIKVKCEPTLMKAWEKD